MSYRSPVAVARAQPPVCRAATIMLLAAALSVLPQAVLAQTPVGNGRLGGVVMDADGNPVAGATITLTQLSTQAVVTATTNDKGEFRKGGLGSGRWNVDISAPGFKPKAMSAAVRDRSNQNFEVALERGDAEVGVGVTLFGGELGDKINAANALYSSGDYAGALAALDTLIAEEMAKDNPNPNVHLVHINSGNAAFEMDNYDLATSHYEATLAVETANNEARMGMAKIHMVRRDVEAAMAEFEQIDLQRITDPIVFYNIGNLLFGQGQSAEAQRYFEMALALNPDDVDSHMQVALCLIQQGMMEESRTHLEKVIELAPETQNAADAQSFLEMIG